MAITNEKTITSPRGMSIIFPLLFNRFMNVSQNLGTILKQISIALYSDSKYT